MKETSSPSKAKRQLSLKTLTKLDLTTMSSHGALSI